MTFDLRPMLASPTTATTGRRAIDMATLVDTHAFDEKIDGVRALITVHDGSVHITNRNGVDRTNVFPELLPYDMLDCVLDGEIVCTKDDSMKWSFEATAIRDKQTIPQTHHLASYPAWFMCFDVLYVGNNDVRRLPWKERRQLMERIVNSVTAPTLSDPLHFTPTLLMQPPNGEAMYEHIVANGGEGVIAKDVNSPYEPGRKKSWLKFKHTQSITCVAVGYEPGNGARTHFGAMHLALVGPNGPVQVGRVGTGFTDTEIADLKARLDRKELFTVEIECLNVTKTGQLRFPVYKGIRTDVSVVDATLDQLDTIPTC
jgi:bifunctional non-homologous end joining protein LigD